MPDNELTRAGFGPRAAAYIIDRVLLLIALAVVRVPFAIAAFMGNDRLTAGYFLFDHSVLDVVCWLLASAYFVLMTWFGGATLGKMVMRLRVARENGGDLRFIDVLYRETVGRFLSGILCIGYLMVLGDRQKRAFHDWLCGTCVVYDGVTLRDKPKKEAPAADYGWSQPAEAPVDELSRPAVSEPIFDRPHLSEAPEAPAETSWTVSEYGWALPNTAPETDSGNHREE